MWRNSLGRPWAAPWALKGPPGIPLGSSEGTLRPQQPPQNMLTSPFDLLTSVFLSFRRTSHLFTKSHLQKQYKNQTTYTCFEIAISVSFSYFCHLWAPEAPPDRPLESVRGSVGPPSELPPWSPWALQSVTFGLPLFGHRRTKTGLRQQ